MKANACSVFSAFYTHGILQLTFAWQEIDQRFAVQAFLRFFGRLVKIS